VLLDSASTLGDLAAIGSLGLQKLKGNRNGFWSIRVNKQWRIIFEWSTEGAKGVELGDYHA
jgi:proteic killer suppression protein